MIKTWNAQAIGACESMANALILLNAAGDLFCEQRSGSAYGMLSNALKEALATLLPEILVEFFYEGLVFEQASMTFLLSYYKLVD